jgi:hypothetical protein
MNATAVCKDLSATSAARFTLERAHVAQASVETWLFSKEAMALPLNDVEREQEKRSREAQRLLLQAHIQARGRGDVGMALKVIATGEKPEATYAHRREHDRDLQTVFGAVQIKRQGYGRPGERSLHPLDEELDLPERTYSYELQRRLVKKAVQGPFDEAVEAIEEATGVTVPKRSAEEVVKDAAKDFDAFYAQREWPESEPTGALVVGAVDGKGVPMVKPEEALRVVRRGKGEKANKKRMATVGAVFTQEPRVRTPEEVVESLFRTGPRSESDERPRVRPENKRIWASLTKSKEEVIQEVGAEMKRRDLKGQKKHVVVTDGERALQQRVMSVLPTVVLILDLLHVLGYLWKAAYVFHPEGSPEAEAWVKERALRILNGEVSQVVKGLRQMVTKRALKGSKRKTLLGVAGYLYRNRSRMRYHEYLAQGFPIASGAVEGACKNLIKDRMERSGMRWTLPSAEAMIQLRATYLSDDLDPYWAFHMAQDQLRLHPPGLWHPVESVVAK